MLGILEHALSLRDFRSSVVASYRAATSSSTYASQPDPKILTNPFTSTHPRSRHDGLLQRRSRRHRIGLKKRITCLSLFESEFRSCSCQGQCFTVDTLAFKDERKVSISLDEATLRQ